MCRIQVKEYRHHRTHDKLLIGHLGIAYQYLICASTRHCSLLSCIIPLPALPYQQWPGHIIEATRTLANIYNHAAAALSSLDNHWIEINRTAIISNETHLLQAMQDSGEGIPEDWIRSYLEAFGELLSKLDQAEKDANGR